MTFLETSDNWTKASLSSSNWTTKIIKNQWLLLNKAELSDVILVNHSENGSLLDFVNWRISHGCLSCSHQISLSQVSSLQILRNRHQEWPPWYRGEELLQLLRGAWGVHWKWGS
jgi:hypothetical protein